MNANDLRLSCRPLHELDATELQAEIARLDAEISAVKSSGVRGSCPPLGALNHRRWSAQSRLATINND